MSKARDLTKLTIDQLDDNALDCEILNVYSYNLAYAFAKMRSRMEIFKFVAFDAEFPGDSVNYGKIEGVENQYEAMRSHVSTTKLIQLGITLMDENGIFPDGIHTWQFHFKFDECVDKIGAKPKRFLKDAGINFDVLKSEGVKHTEFIKHFIKTDFFCNDDYTFLTFHGCNDYLHLLMLLCKRRDGCMLTLNAYLQAINNFFPTNVDLKCVVEGDGVLNRLSLTDVAANHNVVFHEKMIAHQAGYDSYITAKLFYKLQRLRVYNNYDRFIGHIYQFGNTRHPSQLPRYFYVPNPRPIQPETVEVGGEEINEGEDETYGAVRGASGGASRGASGGTSGGASRGASGGAVGGASKGASGGASAK